MTEPTLPQSGGSFTRETDGTLTRISEAEATGSKKPAAKPAAAPSAKKKG